MSGFEWKKNPWSLRSHASTMASMLSSKPKNLIPPSFRCLVDWQNLVPKNFWRENPHNHMMSKINWVQVAKLHEKLLYLRSKISGWFQTPKSLAFSKLYKSSNVGLPLFGRNFVHKDFNHHGGFTVGFQTYISREMFWFWDIHRSYPPTSKSHQ